MSSLDTPAVHVQVPSKERSHLNERYAQKLHVNSVSNSMASVGRNPQQRNKTSKLGGLKGEETNKLIFQVNIYGRRSHTGFNQDQFLHKAVNEPTVL